MSLATDAPSFGQVHFGGAPLGDRRRVRRLVQLADRMAAHPRGSLPEKLRDPAMYQGMIRLMRHDSVTHASVLKAHAQRTRRAMTDADGVVLILHDLTELDFTGHESLTGLGQIGDGGGRDYECFHSLAVRADRGEVLGLAAQILHKRPAVAKDEGAAAKRRRQTRESRLWLQGAAAVGPAPDGCRWVDVADRGADTFEFLESEHKQGRRYVIRSCQSRAMLPGHDGDGPPALLHDYGRARPARGRRTVRVSARPASAGHEAQPAREAEVAVAWAAVRIKPPHVHAGEHSNDPLPVWLVRVWEPSPPADVEPLEWFLLTNEPVADLERAWERADWYQRRPIVEEFHQAQKTGCAIEAPQFTREARLEPMIALLSVVACLLVGLRDLCRDEAGRDRPAVEVVPREWVEVLGRWRYGAACPGMTVREFCLALGRMGGHQNREGDGLPGWQTLWKGWIQLQNLVEYTCKFHPNRSDQT